MKLELKHIPQINNKAEIKILNHKCDYVGIKRAKVNGYYYIGEELYLTYEGGSTGKSQNECKLILHPLSDLTKEIEVNREKFIPISKLQKSNAFLMVEGSNFVNFSSGQKIELNNLPYWVIQKLHEWHFDTSGLIEAGLAIDINKL